MISKKQFVQLCKQHDLVSFETETMLDYETDIILSSDNIEELFLFCEMNNIKTIFYMYIEECQEDYYINENVVREEIKGIVDHELDSHFYNINEEKDETYKYQICEKYTKQIMDLADKQNNQLRDIIWGTPLWLDAFVLYQGNIVGISLHNTDASPADDLKSMRDFCGMFSEKLLSEINEYKVTQSEKNQEKFRKEIVNRRNEQNEKYGKALDKVKEFLKTSEKISECTNGKLRKEYAREIANQFSAECEITLTLGSVEVLVEQEYKRRKK